LGDPINVGEWGFIVVQPPNDGPYDLHFMSRRLTGIGYDHMRSEPIPDLDSVYPGVFDA
jgi:hypothetical protein